MTHLNDIVAEAIAFVLALTLTAGACSRQHFPTRSTCEHPAEAREVPAK